MTYGGREGDQGDSEDGCFRSDDECGKAEFPDKIYFDLACCTLSRSECAIIDAFVSFGEGSGG